MATAKQRAAAKRNIKKAQAARKRKGRKKTTRKRSPAKRRTTRRKTAPKRRTNMARRKKRSGSRGQSIVSWGINLAALGIVMSPVLIRAKQAMDGGGWSTFATGLVSDYSGVQLGDDGSYQGFDASALARGYGPLIGGIAFKKGMGMVTKHIRVKGLPKL